MYIFIVCSCVSNKSSLSVWLQGLGFLTMSTPPVLAHVTGTCSEYRPECIGHGQKVLLYAALPLIAFGIAGHLTSFNTFLAQQFIELPRDDHDDYDSDDDFESTFWRFFCSGLAVIIVTFVAVLGLPYIKPWSLQFGIPAICTLVATVLIFSGSFSYKYFGPMGSPLTMFFRVFVASASKMLYNTPRNDNELFEIRNPHIYSVPHTMSLRFLCFLTTKTSYHT